MRERIINLLNAGSIDRMKLSFIFSTAANEMLMAVETDFLPTLLGNEYFADYYHLNQVPSKESFEPLAPGIEITSLLFYYSAFVSDTKRKL
jgi:hypothetical protein